jgi:hypothetical protein
MRRMTVKTATNSTTTDLEEHKESEHKECEETQTGARHVSNTLSVYMGGSNV